MDIYGCCITAVIVLYLITMPFKSSKKIYCIVTTFLLLCLLGFRASPGVGVDLFRYRQHFSNMERYSMWGSLFYSVDSPLYYLSNWVFQRSGLEFQAFTFVLAAFEMGVIGCYFYKYSLNPMISYFAMVGMGCYTFLFSGLRQGVAMAVAILCFEALLKRQRLRCGLLFLIALGFHPTAIILLVFFLITRIRISKLLICGYLIALGVFGLFRIQIGHLVTYFYDQSYLGYYDISGKIGLTAVFTMLLTAAFIAVCYRKAMVKGSLEYYLAHGLMFLTLLQVLSAYAYAFTRLNLYFILIIVSLALPYIAEKRYLARYFGRYRKIVGVCAALAFIVIMATQFDAHIDGEYLRNYQFFWQ